MAAFAFTVSWLIQVVVNYRLRIESQRVVNCSQYFRGMDGILGGVDVVVIARRAHTLLPTATELADTIPVMCHQTARVHPNHRSAQSVWSRAPARTIGIYLSRTCCQGFRMHSPKFKIAEATIAVAATSTAGSSSSRGYSPTLRNSFVRSASWSK